MLRRRRISIVLMLCAVLLSLADAAHPTPTYAGAVLMPGDFVGADGALKSLSVTTSTTSELSNDPHFDHPYLIATGPSGEVYVADNYYNIDDFTNDAAIVRVDPTTGIPSVVVRGGLGFLTGLTVDRGGRLYVVDDSGSRIVRIVPTTGARTTLSTGGKLISPSGAAIEGDGSILTTALVSSSSYNGPRQIVRIRTGTNGQEVVSSGGGLVQPRNAAVAPNGWIYVADSGGNLTPPRVLQIHPQTGAQSEASRFEGGGIGGIVVRGDGMIFVLAYAQQTGTGIYKFHQSGGERSLVGPPYSFGNFGNIAIVQAASQQPCPTPSRQPVQVKATPLGGGRLQVNVHVNGSPNAIRSIQLGPPPPNAVVENPPFIDGYDAVFVLKRTGPGAVTQRFTVVDACGAWPTFVGGGAGAF